MYRVQKVLSLLGILSRRDCEKKIKLGLVKINNKVALLGSKVVIGDKISFDNQDYYVTTELLDIDTKILMYHKPQNEIVSRNDPQKRHTVFENLPQVTGKWINIGRLDYDSSGLILFTNNGMVANKMMHPSSNIIRTYEVIIDGNIDAKKIKLSLEGIDIGNDEIGKFVDIMPEESLKNKYIVKLKTGKNREVRRIFSALNCEVLKLKRISYGNIELGHLESQSYKYLEIKMLSEFL